jgi:serine/threonine protein kinase/WD40 repeat protein
MAMHPSTPSVETVLAEAVEILSASERQAYVKRACGADVELRRRVEKLIVDYFRAGSFLQSPVVVLETADARVEIPGCCVGPYKLLEMIGEGGFGVVYMAEQERPVRRRVALKVLKPGMDTRQVVARFEAERQALALMDHPHIARVLDAGSTESGRPYFVMELVRGVAVTDFCDQARLGVRERLALFVDVCQAVQHAHQKGIIHRDIKPSNVLVTLHDGKPVVKVIDFGIAKATGRQLIEKTLFTNFAQMIGTPLYMSPEQAEMSGLDIDTRSDVYSLGVLLYELLTGVTPFDQERLKAAGFDEFRRIIREEEPPNPSTRVSTVGQAAATASEKRRSDPRKLSRLFRGEMDWVVMKALEKDRNCRYESASAFAADLQRYLHYEPVQAYPPSALYRFRKFVRRNKRPVLAASFVALALVGGIIGTTWGLFRATDARADAVYEATLKENALEEKVAALAAAENSERAAKNQLFQALVNRARAERGGGRVGQRFETLKAIRQAAQIRMTPELRTEATAALVLTDVELAQEWEGWPADSVGVSFDAAFHRYARLDKQGGVTVCRLSDGREEIIARLPVHGKPPFYGLWMSPDGRYVAYGHSCVRDAVPGGVRLWRLDGSEPAVLLDEPAGTQNSALSFHRNGRQMAIGHPDESVSVYDLMTGQRLRRLSVASAPPHLAFHPQDDRLAVACGNDVQLFETNTGKELPALRHPAAVTWIDHLSWHPDGRRLATSCNDRKVHIWDTQTATEVVSPWTGHTTDGGFVAFTSAGDRLISDDWGQQTRFWDTAAGRLLATMPETFGLQFSPDDRLLGPMTSGNKIKLWRFAGGQELRVLCPRFADSLDYVSNPVVHPDGLTLAAATRHGLRFFDLGSGEELASVRLPQLEADRPVFVDPAHASSSSEDRGQTVATSGWMTAGYSGLLSWPARQDDDRPHVLRVGPPQHIGPDLGSAYAVGASASSDGRVVAVPRGSSTVVLHRDPADGRVLRRVVLGPQYDVRFSAVSPDGHWVVTCSHWLDGRSKSIRIWEADTGRQVHEFPFEGSTDAKFSLDGRWLTTTAPNYCRLWEVGSWREVRRFEPGGPMAFSPDKRLLAVSDVLGVIRLVEITTGKEVARLTAPESLRYFPQCFTPDGTRLIATCSSYTAIYVWDLRLIRQQLKELGLDWDWPEFPSTSTLFGTVKPRQVEVFLGDLDKNPTLTRERKARQEIERLRTLVAAMPDDALANNDLAWEFVTSPEPLRDVKGAIPLAEKAVRLAPKNIVYRNTLGVAYYRAGRYREAVDLLRANLASQEDWALASDLYFLAMGHYQLGDTARGRDYYDWAVRWTRAQRGLSEGHLENLTVFRAEAEKLFGITQRKTDHP